MTSQLKPDEVSALLRRQIESFDRETDVAEVGTVLSVGDGIARVDGLRNVMANELLETASGVAGLALNLEEEAVGVAILDDVSRVREGDVFRRTGRVMSVPGGPALTGRVVNALGQAIDGGEAIKSDIWQPVEGTAPSIIERQNVREPLQTGILAVDALTPIGRGQRELIIGDRKTGKTTLAVDAILNQAGTGVRCFYVAIGQKNSTVASLHKLLHDRGAMAYTTIIVAGASDPAPLQYLAPYSGCAMGEYFMDNGEDALIIYDDLTKQAWAYRQISLLLRRPPGREAYPGDVFYLHSRLLERSARVNAEYVEKATGGRVKGKTGSLTGLPIIETQAGDVTAFVPTNVISITDGQIFLETDLFNSGIRPAINAGISVSRVGGAAQTGIIKKLGGGVRLALAQYRELAAFSQFASDLDEATRRQLDRGVRVVELMKQKQYSPMSVAEMALSLYAVNGGYFDKVPREKVVSAEAQLQSFAKTNAADLVKSINDKPELSKDVDAGLKKVCEDFFSAASF